MNVMKVAGRKWSFAHTTKLGNNLENIWFTIQLYHLSSQTVISLCTSSISPIYCNLFNGNKQGIIHLSVPSTHCGANIWYTSPTPNFFVLKKINNISMTMRKEKWNYDFFQVVRICFSIKIYIGDSTKSMKRQRFPLQYLAVGK